MVFLRIIIYLLIFIVITATGSNPCQECVAVHVVYTYYTYV